MMHHDQTALRRDTTSASNDGGCLSRQNLAAGAAVSPSSGEKGTLVARAEVVERGPSVWLKFCGGTAKLPVPDPLHTRLDAKTAGLLQIESLHQAIGKGATPLGPVSLLRSLARPLCERAHIIARQEAVKELESDKRLKDDFQRFLSLFRTELQGGLRPFVKNSFPSKDLLKQDFLAAQASMARICEAATNLPVPSSPLLKLLADEIRSVQSTRLASLFKGTMIAIGRGYERDLALADEVGLVPRILDRHGWPFNPRMALGGIGFAGGFSALLALPLGEPRLAVSGLGMALMFLPMLMMSHRHEQEYKFYRPLQEHFLAPGFTHVADSIAQLDELLILSSLVDRFPGGGCFPEVEEAEEHFVDAEEVHNPTIALSGRLSIANDFKVGSVPWAITGPNSGGKSTAAITLGQLQILAQSGARVPATACKIAIADRIFYQAQAFNALEDKEGRFGTELLEGKTILDKATPRSLRVFDELAQGTTRGESEVQAANILRAHASIGGTCIFITHAFELVERLAREGVALPKKIEFRQGVATHRLVDGISSYSGADKVAKRVKMDPESLRAALQEKGLHPKFDFEEWQGESEE